MPLTRAAQVYAAYAALFKESPRGLPVVLLRLARASARLLLERGIYLVCKRLERGDVSPGARAHGAREENAEGGEAEAALALLGGLTPVEDADATMGVIGEVAVIGMRGLHQKKRGEGGGRAVDEGGCGALTRHHALRGAVRWEMR
jgi:hypothetical protein